MFLKAYNFLSSQKTAPFSCQMEAIIYVINFKISGHSVVTMETLLALVSLGQKPVVLIFKSL